MNRVKLYPYPRIDGAFKWSPLGISVNGRPAAPEEVADLWDHHSEINIVVSAEVPSPDLAAINIDRLELALTARSHETAVAETARAPFSVDAENCHASAAVQLSGIDVAHQIEVRATVVAPLGDEKWLSRRIIAERRVEHINLDSDLSGFPTSAVSFKENYRPPSPWALDVTATDLTDPFAHSIRLNLNIDMATIREFIAGTPSTEVRSSLDASILRVLIQTTRKLSEESDNRPRSAIAEFPDSIAAAADKACQQFLKMPLTQAVSLQRHQPEALETRINGSVGLLENKR